MYPIVCGALCCCIGVWHFVSFLIFCNNLAKEETADFFVFIFFLMISCFCYAMWNFLLVLWVGLPCVMVIFPDHTHLNLDFLYLMLTSTHHLS